ncbi:hypothetical protein GDO81_013685 [Engystomops pustulosus]|uniref:Uncharacterized protein n=1 Tax=Engystomops pustulosus TaxID=76066 RepID=A0AAV7B4X2_ENGPU|nr:hypothetical protein GDO81_013685 [Engystomops pustulosus]
MTCGPNGQATAATQRPRTVALYTAESLTGEPSGDNVRDTPGGLKLEGCTQITQVGVWDISASHSCGELGEGQLQLLQGSTC